MYDAKANDKERFAEPNCPLNKMAYAPIVSSLSDGKIVYSEKSKTNSLEIKGGIVEVLENKVSALIEK